MTSDDVQAALGDTVDALLVLDEPLLSPRYHGILARRATAGMQQDLARLRGLVLQANRVARAGARKWARASAHVVVHDFLDWGERTLLDSFLSLAETEMRVLASAARAAPTREIRADFDQTVLLHREAARTLRDALAPLDPGRALAPPPRMPVRPVQEEAVPGDLRGQIEAAMRGSLAAGRPIRQVALSPTALRHLRDQGCFQDGETTLLQVPVVVDFGWDVSAFALQTRDCVPLEEIVQERRERAG